MRPHWVFPTKGILFIENEGIYYESKTHNQFLNCQRGYIGVERYHDKGTIVYGPYYLEGQKVEDGKVYVSRSWPLGLVSDVNIKDPGLLHTIDDIVEPNGPGRVEPREPALTSILENYDDDLATQYEIEPKIGYVGNYTHGPSGVYFDDRNIYVASSNLPEYMIGTFSTDDSVGPDLEGISDITQFLEDHQFNPTISSKTRDTIKLVYLSMVSLLTVMYLQIKSNRVVSVHL